MPEHAPGAAPGHRLRYDGRLGDLYRIFFLNLLLTVLTLGIWRFWARTRLRRHVWQHLSLDGQRLEYTGTGGELFRGFLLALLVIVPLLFAMGLTQMLAPEAARLASFALYLPAGLLGFAGAFTARRYLLSRTLLNGVAFHLSGSPWRYGAGMLGRMFLSFLTLGLSLPWMAATSLRWTLGETSYGTARFTFTGRGGQLFPWYLLAALLAAILTFAAVAAFLLPPILQNAALFQGGGRVDLAVQDALGKRLMVLMLPVGGVFLLSLQLAGSLIQAAQWRLTVRSTSLEELRFRSRRGTLRVALFLFGNALLVWLSLGLLWPLAQHRSLRFFADDLLLSGEMSLARVRQAEGYRPGHGEGLADVLGAGASVF